MRTLEAIRSSAFRARYSVSAQQGLVANDHREFLYKAVERVIELHAETRLAHIRPDGQEILPGQCAECGVTYPCPSIEALTKVDDS